jgi:hypothetical protein
MKSIKFDNKEYDTSSAEFNDKVMNAYGYEPVRDYVKNTLKKDVDWDGKNVTLDGNAFITPGKVINGRNYAKTSELDRAAGDYVKGQGMVGISDYSKNNLGMNNLGWNNGNVTYDGKNFITPQYNIGGTTYSTPSEISAAAEAFRTNNKYVPVRQNMQNQGFYNKGLGYKDGNLTYYGNNIGNPDMVVDGISYMAPEKYDEMLKKMTKDDVDASALLSSMGISNGVKYNSDGTVSILGKSVPVQQLKTDDTTGKHYAYVNGADFENVVNNYKKENPTIADVYKENQEKYGARIDKALKALEKQEEFEYDLEDDPAYQSYKESAMRNAEKAHEDTMARMSAMTGGYANSNAIAAAAQARDAHLDTLNDRIPELYRAAYERYNADRQREFDRLEAILGTSDRQYNNSLTTALQLQQLLNSANQNEWQRYMSEQERNDNQAQLEKENFYKNWGYEQTDRQLNQGDAQINLAQKQADDNIKLALLELLVSAGNAGLGFDNTLYNYASQALRNNVK